MHIERTPWASRGDATTISETNPLMINKGVRHLSKSRERLADNLSVEYSWASTSRCAWQERDGRFHGAGRGREREQSIPLICPLFCVDGNVFWTLLERNRERERERERFLQVVVAGDGDDRETTDIPFEKGTIGILTIVSLVCRCSSRFSLLRIYFRTRMDVEKKETRNWANVNISDKFFW